MNNQIKTETENEAPISPSLLNGGLAETPCDGYCADLGCDKIAIAIPGRCETWKQYCARCAARVKIDGEFFKGIFG